MAKRLIPRAVPWLLAVLCTTPLARAQGVMAGPSDPKSEAAPYDSWTGDAAFPAPRPLSRRETPGPLVPEPELARSAVELVAGVGPVFGWCFGGGSLSFPCQGLDPGLVGSVSGLWRVTPFFAWGGRASASLFAYDPPAELDAQRTRAVVAALEVAGRVYVSDEGLIDPYAELGFGAAALRTALNLRTTADYEHSAFAPAVHVGGGLDFVLGRSAKVGLAAALNQVFVPGLRRCPAAEEGRRADEAGTDRGYVSSTLELGGSFTVMLGNEL